MFKKLISLEWKSFVRSASFKTNLLLKILMVFGAFWIIVSLTMIGVGLFYLLKEMGLEPFVTINRFLIYYVLIDLTFRYFLQKMPVMNIRPLLSLKIPKNTIVHYTLGKTMASFFNWMHLFFLLPFSIVLIKEGFDSTSVWLWAGSIFLVLYINNFLIILINNKDVVFYAIFAMIVAGGLFHYFNIFDATIYTEVIFTAFYDFSWIILVLLLILIALYSYAFTFFKSNLYLDAGLAVRTQEGKTEEYIWLNQFGTLGTFLKNDIRLIRRNKRSKTTVLTSVIFLFYGLLFFSGSIEAYESPIWRIFAGIFVSGGFLFTFGQFVPSWDSAYYPLMMSQNIQYKEYLNAKWWLVVIATAASTVLASFYLYFGWEVYLAIIVGAIYNIGVNAHLVLWGGAYIKTPIDLSKNKNVFGDKQAFNVKSLLLTIPKLVLPMVIYGIGHFVFSPNIGFAMVALTGILGYAFKGKVFSIIETIYHKEKYKTIAAYKQN
jgi:hypothetical protein